MSAPVRYSCTSPPVQCGGWARRCVNPDPDRKVSLTRTLRTGLAAYAQDDYGSALRQLAKAAHAGDAEAQYRLGPPYPRGKGANRNLGEAIDRYRGGRGERPAEAATA